MEKIIIRDFGPIEYIDFTLEKNFNIIIGEQATGKSTLAKLIYFFKDIINDLESVLIRQPERIKNNTSNEILEKYYLNVRKKFIISFGSNIENSKKDTEIVYFYENERKAILTVNNGSFKFCYDENTEIEILKILDKCLKVLEKQNDFMNYFPRISFYAFLIDRIFEKNYRRHIFIPACRHSVIYEAVNESGVKRSQYDMFFSSIMNNIMNFKMFNETFDKNDIKEAYKKSSLTINDVYLRVNSMINIKKSILKGEYKWDRKNNKEWIKLNKDEILPIEFTSSGQQEVLWILNILTMIMMGGRNTFIIIEEPEAHLFPSTQLELVKLISLVINTTDSEILITTHSPYILSSFNLLTCAGKVEKNYKEGIVENYLRINPKDIGSYKLKSGKCLDIFDYEESLIKSEEIDEISECINEAFDKLLEKSFELKE